MDNAEITDSPPTHQVKPVDWIVWQLADSSFPMGGFAHSGGLEAAWQQGEVHSRSLLLEFVRTSLIQTARAILPFADECHRHPERHAELDRRCEAFLSNHAANRASRAQGRAILAAAERTFSVPGLASLSESLNAGELAGHFAPMFGWLLRWLEIDRDTGLRLLLFFGLRGCLSSAVRLGLIGPLEAQAHQFQLAPFAEALCEQFGRLAVDDAAQVAPVIEILHGAHDRLHSRLFQT